MRSYFRNQNNGLKANKNYERNMRDSDWEVDSNKIPAGTWRAHGIEPHVIECKF